MLGYENADNVNTIVLITIQMFNMLMWGLTNKHDYCFEFIVMVTGSPGLSVEVTLPSVS